MHLQQIDDNAIAIADNDVNSCDVYDVHSSINNDAVRQTPPSSGQRSGDDAAVIENDAVDRCDVINSAENVTPLMSAQSTGCTRFASDADAIALLMSPPGGKVLPEVPWSHKCNASFVADNKSNVERHAAGQKN